MRRHDERRHDERREQRHDERRRFRASRSPERRSDCLPITAVRQPLCAHGRVPPHTEHQRP